MTRIRLIPIIFMLLPGVPMMAQQHSYADALSAARLEVQTLQKKVNELELRLQKYESGTRINVWDDLTGTDIQEDDVFSTISSSGKKVQEVSSPYADKIKIACPETWVPFREEVNNFIEFYAFRKRDQMGKILERYYRTLPVIAPKFSYYGIPDEVYALCIVESAVSTKALSPAGAYGLWQLMPETALQYGLQVNLLTDEREDAAKSTDVAARLLRDLYKSFGRWDLAVLAYNCGPGNVRKAMYKAEGKTGFWDIYPYLPKETRGYLLSLHAVRYVMCFADELGIKVKRNK